MPGVVTDDVCSSWLRCLSHNRRPFAAMTLPVSSAAGHQLEWRLHHCRRCITFWRLSASFAVVIGLYFCSCSQLLKPPHIASCCNDAFHVKCSRWQTLSGNQQMLHHTVLSASQCFVLSLTVMFAAAGSSAEATTKCLLLQ